MAGESDQLDKLVEAVRASSKYKSVCADLIRNIGFQQLSKRRNLKEALKATRNKLHQVGGAYLDSREEYAAWLSEIRKAVQTGTGYPQGVSLHFNRDELRRVCTQAMSRHASARERLPILDQFYSTILADLTPIRTVLDIACGLNPIALPWMPLAEDVEYYAYDIYQNMMDFLNEFMALLSVQGHAEARDVIQACPTQKVDVAFLLKTIPCLEQVDKAAGHRLLHTINAKYIVVSFPVHSLGGRDKGMAAHYEARFRELVANEKWEIRRFEFSSELVFLVRK